MPTPLQLQTPDRVETPRFPYLSHLTSGDSLARAEPSTLPNSAALPQQFQTPPPTPQSRKIPLGSSRAHMLELIPHRIGTHRSAHSDVQIEGHSPPFPRPFPAQVDPPSLRPQQNRRERRVRGARSLPKSNTAAASHNKPSTSHSSRGQS